MGALCGEQFPRSPSSQAGCVSVASPPSLRRGLVGGGHAVRLGVLGDWGQLHWAGAGRPPGGSAFLPHGKARQPAEPSRAFEA